MRRVDGYIIALSIWTCLVGQVGCAGKVELVALSSTGGTSGFSGLIGTGATAVQPRDSGVAGAGIAICLYNGSVYAQGMSFPSTDGCNTCSCSSYGTVGCTTVACNWGVGGALSNGGAASIGGAIAVAGAPGTGGVPSIVPACPGLDLASSSSFDAGAQCAGVAIDVEAISTDLFIMLDRTQSMTYTLQNSTLQRWDAIVQGLQQFTYQSTRVGLNYFGKTGNPNDPTECDPNTYAQAAVPIDYLSNNSASLVQSVTDERAILGGQTPWYPALQGGLQFAQTWQIANPSRRVAFVFVTDGYPTECDQDITDITSVVSDALQARGVFAGGPSIYTYMIGVAVDKFNLDAVAQAGGTNQATIVDGPTAPDQFAAALQAVVSLTNSTGMRCDLSVPTPPAGQVLDPNMVQVTVNNQLIPRADSAANCGGPNGGWYFDNPSSPTQITFCPCTCSSIAAGSIEVRFGCRPPRSIN